MTDEAKKETPSPADRDTGGRRRALTVFGAIVLAVLVGGAAYRYYRQHHVSTDDAFIEGAVHTIAPRVAGTVLRVHVSANQAVRAGELLLELDPAPYEAALREAEGALSAESSGLEEAKAAREAGRKSLAAAKARRDGAVETTAALDAAVRARQADVEARQAVREKAEQDLARAERLLAEEVITKDRFERAETTARSARAAVAVAQALVEAARADRRSHEARLREAQAAVAAETAALKRREAAVETWAGKVERRRAQVDAAKLRLSYTRVTAPVDGYVTRKSVEAGDTLQAGRPVMALVPLTDLYVVANYKETKVGRLGPGLEAEIEVDALPGRRLRGHVESIMAGTGSAFSLFPPENATGNFVKVVQRVPVKIVFDAKENLDGLRVGMSVLPTVRVP